jgi:hypothetical protein
MNSHTFPKLFVTSILILLVSAKSIAQSATLTVNQDPKIIQLLELKKNLEKEREFSDGYTIQLYYGELDKANQTLRKYKGSYSNWPASIEYETPNYKVWAGNFASRIEAERAFFETRKAKIKVLVP